nr:histone-lysine N-methyltransferase SETMAR-like [Penaeus vannamei]
MKLGSKEAIKTKRRGMLTKGVCLLQDNALAHSSHIAQIEWRSFGFILPHPPYSPALAPSDFHLFPFLESFFAGYLEVWAPLRDLTQDRDGSQMPRHTERGFVKDRF